MTNLDQQAEQVQRMLRNGEKNGHSGKITRTTKKAGYSQEQVAEKLGISRQAVSKWESGQGNPEIDNVVKLTELYNVSADYILLGRENNIIVSEPEKKTMSKEARIALAVISVIAATALVTVLFIMALGTYAGL